MVREARLQSLDVLFYHKSNKTRDLAGTTIGIRAKFQFGDVKLFMVSMRGNMDANVEFLERGFEGMINTHEDVTSLKRLFEDERTERAVRN